MIAPTDKNSNSSSLEDRHFLSDPRPLPGLDLPTWEVDVHREGVEQPILTLRVDSKILPPRKKKKKTVWKLPDSIETNPKFGEQDKRRVLELFREKKKELKKLKNKQRAYRRASSIEAMHASGVGKDSGDGKKTNLSNNASPNPKNLHPENGLTHSPNGVNSNVKNDNRDDSLSPPGFGKLSLAEPENQSTTTAPPPGISNSFPLKSAPPGLPSKSEHQMNGQGHENYQNGVSPPSGSTSEAPPGLQQNGQHPAPPRLMNGNHAPKYEVSTQPRAVGPCFVLPPEAPPGASIGKFVTETYYLFLRNGLIHDLNAYYYQLSEKSKEAGGSSDVVHKALTVGGAHAVCATPQDRLVQLQTFAGCEMRIKGVQQQPTVGNGILILITGVNIRNISPPPGSNGQAQQPQKQQLPFCHTLIMKPVSTTTAATLGSNLVTSAATTPTIGYQILNDNLVILTGDE